MLISGGVGENVKSVEILHANGSYWCSLPDLPWDGAVGHSQSGLVCCGGIYSVKSCLTFSSGQWRWRTSHQLQHERYYHSSWTSKHGVVLIGGRRSQNSTEMLTEDGKSSPSFTLKYDT